MSDSLNFESLEFIEIPVTINGEKYTLKECSGAGACIYQNAMSKCSKFVNGEFAGVEGPVADTQPLLVSLCLTDSKGMRVPEVVIKKWPARIVKSLYKKAKEISDLDEEDDKKDIVKNDSKTTEDGSD